MKNLKNLGKVLGKKEQKSINGGRRDGCCNPTNSCCLPNPKYRNGVGCEFIYSQEPWACV